MVVYRITNKINGKIYIGQTTRSINERWNEHCRRGSECTKLSRAIQKYDQKNFKIEIIENCSSLSDLNKAEEYWIKELNSIENGYNLATGGANSKHSKETKNKISKKSKKMWQNPKHKKNISKKLKKNKNTKEEKLKASKRALKNWNNPEIRDKNIKNSVLGLLKKRKKPFNVYESILLYNGGVKGRIYKKGKLIGTWENKTTCAEDLKICNKKISSVLIGKRMAHKGYIFEYIGENNGK